MSTLIQICWNKHFPVGFWSARRQQGISLQCIFKKLLLLCEHVGSFLPDPESETNNETGPEHLIRVENHCSRGRDESERLRLTSLTNRFSWCDSLRWLTQTLETCWCLICSGQSSVSVTAAGLMFADRLCTPYLGHHHYSHNVEKQETIICRSTTRLSKTTCSPFSDLITESTHTHRTFTDTLLLVLISIFKELYSSHYLLPPADHFWTPEVYVYVSQEVRPSLWSLRLKQIFKDQPRCRLTWTRCFLLS